MLMFRLRGGLLMLGIEGSSYSRIIWPFLEFSMRTTGTQLQGHLCGCQTLVQLQTFKIWGFGSLGVRACVGNWQGVRQVSATLRFSPFTSVVVKLSVSLLDEGLFKAYQPMLEIARNSIKSCIFSMLSKFFHSCKCPNNNCKSQHAKLLIFVTCVILFW